MRTSPRAWPASSRAAQYEALLAEEGFEAVTATDLTMGVAAIVKATASAKAKSRANGHAQANGEART